MNERCDVELEKAIEDVVEWLDYEVWHTCPELQTSVQHLRNAWLTKLAHDRRKGESNG